MSKTIEEHTSKRDAIRYTSTRLWTPHPNKIGVLGEIATAEFLGVEFDLTDKPHGDGRFDFVHPFIVPGGEVKRFKLDAKCASNHRTSMMIDVDHCDPNVIYVQCLANVELTKAEVIGWEWGRTVKKVEPQMARTMAHIIPFAKLRDKLELLMRLVR